ncbi:MAG: GNAT family N-acetyltransferase [Clostridia bacterium]|nr:GNAT family N-acetyltransferase [Clostridia bacterium]
MEAIEVRGRYVREIKKLYISAFPKVERKPFWLMMLNQKRGKMKIFYLSDNNEFAGLAVMAEHNDRALLLYFAIAENKRDCGYGSKALKMLMKRYEKKRFYLEIESTKKECENKEIRLRRKSFYIKNGMAETGLNVNLFGVEMEVLSNGALLGYDEYIEPYEKNFGKWIRRKIREVK